MTRKSSYDVFLLTFWRIKISYDDLRVFPCYKICGNYVNFRAFTRFFPLHQDIFSNFCVESVRVRTDLFARSCMMTRLVC